MSDQRATQGGERSDHFQTDRVATIAAGHAVHDTYTAFLPALLPAFIERLLLSKTEAGLLSACLQMPSLLQPVIGHLADSKNLRLVVILAPGVTAVGMSLLGLAPSYLTLALMLLVVGLSSAALHAVAPVVAGRLSGPSLGRGMGFWMVGGELGRTLGPLVVVSVIGLLTLEGMAVLALVGLATSAILYVRLGDIDTAAARFAQALPWRAALRQMGPVFLPIAGIIVVRAFVNISMTLYLPVYLTEQGESLWMAGAALSVLEGAGVVGALSGGWLSDRLGRRRVVLTAMGVSPFLLLAFVGTDGWLRFALLPLLGLALLSVSPVMMALVQESFPGRRALANGLYLSTAFVVRSAAAVIVGVVGDTWGLNTAFLASGAGMLLGLPLVLLLPRSRRKA